MVKRIFIARLLCSNRVLRGKGLLACVELFFAQRIGVLKVVSFKDSRRFI